MFNRKAVFVALGVLVLGLAVFALQRHFSRSSQDGGSAAESGSDVRDEFSFVKATSNVLEPADPQDCAALKEQRDQMRSPKQLAESADATAFVYFDIGTRILTFCSDGKATSAVLPKQMGDLADDEEMVRVSDSIIGDLNGDGKEDFTLFHGQCVEGPCIGYYYMYQVEDGRLRQIYQIQADGVDRIGLGTERVLLLTRNCYTYDFGIGLTYMAVAEFNPKGELNLIPMQDIRKRFPSALPEPPAIADVKDPDPSPAEQTIEDIQKLIDNAYHGAAADRTMEAYDELMKSTGDSLPLHCNPKKILEGILASGGGD